MSVQVYGCNHVAIEVGDIKKAVEFYQDLFGLEKLDEGEGDAFFKLGEHQFLAMFERKNMRADASDRHFGIMVRDANQVAEVRDKLTKKYKLELIPPFGCDFCDPWGNRIQVVDLHDESLVWLLPYREVQKGPQARIAPHTGGGQSNAPLAATPASILMAIFGGNGAVLRSFRSAKALMHSKMADRLPLVSSTMNIR